VRLFDFLQYDDAFVDALEADRLFRHASHRPAAKVLLERLAKLGKF
jgi:hypothetical protein